MAGNTLWNLKRINKAARLLQNKYHENAPAVSVEKIVLEENIFVKYHSRTEVTFPIAVKKGNRYGILICSLLEEEIKRWHMACALGGIALGYLDGNKADSLTEDKISEQDRQKMWNEMEIFAGELLIPENWARTFLTKDYSMKSLMEIQTLCKVPLGKLVYRFRLLEASAQQKRFGPAERIATENKNDLPRESGKAVF